MYEKTVASRRIYQGRVVTLDVLDVELENGVRSTREIVRHCGAVAVLPRLPDGRFLLVKQFRKAIDRVFIEVVAGTLEDGEEPEVCARRELKEETGYTARKLELLGTTYPSPGYVGERIDIYYAECEDSPTELSTDHDEQIEPFPVTAGEINRMILSGEIQDAKSLAAWLLYEKSSVGD